MSASRQTRVEISIDDERGVFMISVAAELAHMHPQTLRIYEARGLITPKRSPKNTRLYSQRDVERLRRIQRMTSEEGLNLAGVETVLELEARVEKLRGELDRARRDLCAAVLAWQELDATWCREGGPYQPLRAAVVRLHDAGDRLRAIQAEDAVREPTV